jgi:TLR4 regulator and MIR-interacting MSAP
MLEMEAEVAKVDPKKMIEVSGFRMTADGESSTKKVQYSKSETYLTDLMETVCKYTKTNRSSSRCCATLFCDNEFLSRFFPIFLKLAASLIAIAEQIALILQKIKT